MAITGFMQREDDGAIQLANNTGLAPGARATVVTEAMIGDGPFGATTGDFDWYRVDLAAGDVVTAFAYSTNFDPGSVDPEISIFNGSGTIVANNDDWDGLDSLETYTAPTSGVYYLRVNYYSNSQSDRFSSGSGDSNLETGNYRLYVNVNSANVNTGTNTDDTINATATDSLINGQGGNDTINGGTGDDVLDGGAGNDTVNGTTGTHDTLIWTWDSGGQTDTYNTGHYVEIHGGDGGDMVMNLVTLTMSAGNTLTTPTWSTLPGAAWKYYSDAGGDVIDVRDTDTIINDIAFELYGGDGNDVLYGGNRIAGDLLDGGAGSDWLSAGAGNDTLYGGSGSDTEAGGSGGDVFRADWDAGDDFFNGGAATDRLAFNNTTTGVTVNMMAGTAVGSETGSDTITGIENVVGGIGSDVFTPDAEANRINGNDGIDTLDFSSLSTQVNINLQADVYAGVVAAGDTYISIENVIGGGGDDSLAGDPGSNRLVGNTGNDTLQGRVGADVLEGGTGDDRLYGGYDDDLMIGGGGADLYNGGAGTGDTVSYGGSSRVSVSLKDHAASSGDAVGDTFTGVENLSGGYGDDYLVGDTGANRLEGALGNDTIFGWTGNDRLIGAQGDDRLFGGGGLDMIRGGAGDDELWGNGDADIFVFASDFGVDRIADFQNGLDLIDVAEVSNITSYSDVQNSLSFNGSGEAVITDGSDILTVHGLTNANIDASDFVFTALVA